AYGPDRVAGFSPIPAMSMVSHAVGARFMSLIGGSMLSFYDWYADLPGASPQGFGGRTKGPGPGGGGAGARSRGRKVVVVSAGFADNVKFADEWMPAQPGTDGALAMAMGHVILTEFFVRLRTPRFVDSRRSYPDLPFLVTLTAVGDGTYRPGKFLTADALGEDAREAPF